MNQEEYCRHLEAQLCWNCHCPTHASHARQRQCPQCRKKWSYDRRRLEWRLAELFCRGLNAYQACREFNISYGTARSHFKKFDSNVLRLKHPAAKVLLSIRDEKNLVPEKWQAVGLRIIFANIAQPNCPRKGGIDIHHDYLMVS